MKGLFLSLLLALSLAGMAKAQDRHSKPNPRLTPGDALNVTAGDLCKPGQAEIEGKISVRVKSQVFDRYGIHGDLIGYHVDHLIPLELGGSNSLKNLWPQPLAGEWTRLTKNRLEHRLRKLVCSGALDLKVAQQEIARDWIGAYNQYISAPEKRRMMPGGSSGMISDRTPGSKMTEKAAESALREDEHNGRQLEQRR